MAVSSNRRTRAIVGHNTVNGRTNGTVDDTQAVRSRTVRHGRKRPRLIRSASTKRRKSLPAKGNGTKPSRIARPTNPEAESQQELTPKQSTFCREYVVDLNGTQAAIRAGYSPRSANEQAARALAKANIRAEVNRLLDERTQRVEVDADFVVRALVENVLRSMQAIPIRDSEGNPNGEYRYNGAVANKALELLGRHLGMFTDKHEIEHSQQPDANFIAKLLAQAEKRTCVIDAEYIERVANGQDP